jgi:hypothetical protein
MIAWKTSSYCEAGSCVEVGWRKSTYSADTWNCVEVKLAKWGKDAFLAGVGDGEFDLDRLAGGAT